jgi:hypothetical protein
MIALALLVPGTADAKKKKKDVATEEPQAAPEVKPDVPDDKASESFADALVELSIARFAPTDSASGAKFLYTALNFNPDNTWRAEGYVEMMDEKMECTEVGTWSMDPAESASKAAINLTINTSDCVSREAGHVSRYLATIEGGTIDVSYR